MALTKITPQMFDTSATAHDLNVDNGTFVVDGSASRVGIGTATPSTLLDVNGALTATTIAGTLTTAAQANITSVGTLSTLTISGDLTVDTSTLKVDSTNNRVGIGITSGMDRDLHIKGSSSDPGIQIEKTGSHELRVAVDSTGPYLYAEGTAPLRFYQNNAEIIRITGGLVGIGTTSPSSFNSLADDLVIGATTGSTGITIVGATNGHSSIYLADGATGASQQYAGYMQYAHGSDALIFGTSATERLRILSDGKIGIGTTSPNQLLEVANSSGGATINISTDQAAGSIASKKFTNLDFSGYNNTVMARIQSWDESSSTGHGYLTFHTIPSGGSLTERMRIDYSGAVGIGTATPQSYYSKNLVVLTDGDGTGGLTLLSPATDDSAYLCFADGTSGAATYAGYLGYSHNDEKAFIGVGGATQMTILSNGRTAIGGNHTPAHALHVKGAVSTTGGVSAVFDGTDSTNTYIQIKNSNSGNSWQIGATGSGVRFYNDQTSSHALGISATGAVEAGAGTVSLPGISFLSDLNSGLYQPAADQIGVVAGGSRKVLVTATNVYFQNLSSSINSGSDIIITKSSAKVEATESGGASVRMIAGGSTGYIGNYSNHELQFMTNSTKRFSVSNAGSVVMDYFLGVRTATRGDGGAFAYSLTMSADNSGNAIEIFRTNNSKMLQYMSADGKYYFDMNGSSTPEIRFRNNGTDWMRTQGTHLFVGGSAPQTKGAGTSAGGTGSNQTILQVQGAVDMGYQGRYTHGLWGPTSLNHSSGRYTHLKTNMWGGGSPHGNVEYIMGGFLITGYRYQGTANHRALHQFHNWNGSMYNYTTSNLIDGGGWTGASNVYVSSDGLVTIMLDSQGSAYRMFYVEYIQYSQYNKISAEVMSITVSNNTTI